MEALIIILFIAGCVCLGLSLAFYIVLWDTLKAHRQAMRALSEELAQRALVRRSEMQSRIIAEESGLGYIPPQEGRQ